MITATTTQQKLGQEWRPTDVRKYLLDLAATAREAALSENPAVRELGLQVLAAQATRLAALIRRTTGDRGGSAR